MQTNNIETELVLGTVLSVGIDPARKLVHSLSILKDSGRKMSFEVASQPEFNLMLGQTVSVRFIDSNTGKLIALEIFDLIDTDPYKYRNALRTSESFSQVKMQHHQEA